VQHGGGRFLPDKQGVSVETIAEVLVAKKRSKEITQTCTEKQQPPASSLQCIEGINVVFHKRMEIQ